MEFRIGINLGDVIEEGDTIYGDGVNIAARLEGMAEAGGICISESAYQQIKNKLPLKVRLPWGARGKEHCQAGAGLPGADRVGGWPLQIG